MKRAAALAVVVVVGGLVVLLWGRSAQLEPAPEPAAADRERVEPPVEEPPPAGPKLAVADLQALRGGRVRGTLSFVPRAEENALQLRYTVRRLPAGEHGLYLRALPDCSAADGSSAGEYHAVHDGVGAAGARLGELAANVSGQARGSLELKDLALDSILAHSVTIETAPADGGALRLVACGVIEAR